MKKITFFALVIALSLGSCKKDDPQEEQKPQREEWANPNPAQNNADIIAQHLSDKVEAIYEATLHNNEIYALGRIASRNNLMKINTSGDVLWSTPVPLKNVHNLAVGNNTIFVVGSYDPNNKETPTRSKVQAYSLDGKFLAEYIFFENNYDRTIVVTTLTEGNNVVVGGCVQKGDIQYPYLTKLIFDGKAFRLDVSISGNEELPVVHSQFPKQRIREIAYKENHIYYTTNQYNQLPDETNKINLTKVQFNSLEKVVYSTPIIPDNPQHEIYTTVGNKIILEGNDIYITAITDDDNKVPAPSDNTFWDSGLVIKFTDNDTSASMVWKQKIGFSNKGENIYHATFYNGHLYIFGEHSSLQYTSAKKSFSNGLIAKIAPDGNVVSSKTFGEKDKNNWLNTGLIVGGQVIGLGVVTSPEKTDYKAWIIKTNL